MKEFALTMNAVLREFRFFEEPPEDIPHKGAIWYEVVREQGFAFEGVQDGKWVIRTTPPPPPAVPDLTFAQLLIGLVAEGWITEADGDGWLAGRLPAPVLMLINTLPSAQRFPAKARALAPSIVLRNDPLVAALGAAQGKTTAQIDAFFTTYAGV